MKFKKISWEDSAHLRCDAGHLLDGVVIVVHGIMFELSECAHIDREPEEAMYWVLDIWDMFDYYGPESDINNREWAGTICFDDQKTASQWLADNVQKRLLMTELHDQDFEVFKALPCVSYKTA